MAIGNRASLAEIELVYRARLDDFRRVARAVLGNKEAARDAVQDGFVRAIRDRAAYRGDGPLEAWVWRCVLNAARSSKRRDVARAPDPPLDAASSGGSKDEDVRMLLRRLPEHQRLVLFLRDYADLDYAAIAEALEIDVGTVGASLHAAHRSLREALEEAMP